MGTGGSKDLFLGVPINPRLDFADDRAKKENRTMRIDAPALVKLQHGTIRYRFMNDEKLQNKKNRIEKAHEGPERSQKHGYFYHSRLNDFSPDAAYKKEESWKFAYVYKGAQCARQKKVYYVFGKGLKTNEAGFILPANENSTANIDSTVLFKVHGHLYFDVLAVPEGDTDEDIGEEDIYTYRPRESMDETGDDRAPDIPPQTLQLKIDQKTTVTDFKIRLAKKYMKPVSFFHLYSQGVELGPDDVLPQLTGQSSTVERATILLNPK